MPTKQNGYMSFSAAIFDNEERCGTRTIEVYLQGDRSIVLRKDTSDSLTLTDANTKNLVYEYTTPSSTTPFRAFMHCCLARENSFCISLQALPPDAITGLEPWQEKLLPAFWVNSRSIINLISSHGIVFYAYLLDTLDDWHLKKLMASTEDIFNSKLLQNLADMCIYLCALGLDHNLDALLDQHGIRGKKDFWKRLVTICCEEPESRSVKDFYNAHKAYMQAAKRNPNIEVSPLYLALGFSYRIGLIKYSQAYCQQHGELPYGVHTFSWAHPMDPGGKPQTSSVYFKRVEEEKKVLPWPQCASAEELRSYLNCMTQGKKQAELSELTHEDMCSIIVNMY